MRLGRDRLEAKTLHPQGGAASRLARRRGSRHEGRPVPPALAGALRLSARTPARLAARVGVRSMRALGRRHDRGLAHDRRGRGPHARRADRAWRCAAASGVRYCAGDRARRRRRAKSHGPHGRRARCARSVHIGLGDLRQFEIDDMGDAVDVDAARGDIGRHHRARLAAPEGGRASARAGPGSCCHGWRAAPMPASSSVCGDAVGAALGPREDDDARHRLVLEQFDEHVALARTVDEDDAFARRDRRSWRWASPPLRRDHAAIRRRACGCRSASSPRRTGSVACRAVRARSRRIDLTKPRSSIWSTSSSTKNSTVAELRNARVHMVDEPAGRRHEHVEALRERLDLRAMRHAAEHDGDRERQAGGEIAKALRDLACEFARRARGRARARRRAAPDADWRGVVEDRQRESGGLAGAGLSDADEIAARHQRRNGLRLDRRRLGVTFLGQGGHERRGEAEAVKIIQLGFLSNSRAMTPENSGAAASLRRGDALRVRAVGWGSNRRSTGGLTNPSRNRRASATATWRRLDD